MDSSKEPPPIPKPDATNPDDENAKAGSRYNLLIKEYAYLVGRQRDREGKYKLGSIDALERHQRTSQHAIHLQIREIAAKLGIDDAKTRLDFTIEMGNLGELMVDDVPVARLPLPNAYLEADEHKYILTPKVNGRIVSQKSVDPGSFTGIDIDSGAPIEGRESDWESSDFAVFVYALDKIDPTNPPKRESETLRERKQKAIALAKGEGLNLFMAISENSDGNQSRLYGVEVPYDRIVSTTQAIRQNYSDYLTNSTHYPTLS